MHEYLEHLEYVMIYLIGLAIALTLAAMPNPARSDPVNNYGAPAMQRGVNDYDEPQPPRQRAPRWSNQHQIDAALATRGRDCASSPDYVPGVDAWGDPVVPADVPRTYPDWMPTQVGGDIRLNRMGRGGRRGHAIGRHNVDLYAGDVYYDLANKELSVNGVPLVKDCIPPTK